MTTDVHEGQLEIAPDVTASAVTSPAKKTWREKRWERRRRRIWLEEVLAWIMVPLIVVGFYYLIEAILGALGTSVSAIAEGIRMIVSSL
jgi:hypothetical protein